MDKPVSPQSDGRVQSRGNWPELWRYAVAVGAVGLAAVVQWALSGLLGKGAAFITFFPAVAVVGMVAGGRAGLVATVLSAAAADWMALGPMYSFGMDSPAEMVLLGLFVVAGVSISLAAEMLGRARQREGQAIEREKAAEEVRRSEARFRAAFEQGGIPMALTSPDGPILRANPAFCQMLRYSEAELRERTFLEITHPEDHAANRAGIERIVRGEQSTFRMEKRYLCKDGRIIWGDMSTALVRDAEGGPLWLVTHIQEITERKQAEANRALLTDVLRILNRGDDLHHAMAEVLRLIRDTAGFDAVGLRLRRGQDCPYYEQNGFSEQFLREENFLCPKRGDGAIVRDAQGRPMLECTCGLVLSGRTDPAMPCFTRGGSFWTNASKELLALPRETDPRNNPRNTCIHAGFQSVGLFPVLGGQEVIGLLQLNDRREGRFTPESVAFFESLAQNIGLALQRSVAEEAVRRAETRLAQAVRVAGLGIFEHDHRSDAIDYSPVMRQLMGFGEAEEVTMEGILQRVVPEDREALAAAIRRAHDPASDGMYAMEHRVRQADGRIRWLCKRSQTFFEGQGSERRPVRTIGATLDVTERKEAQAELERLVAERTAKLQELVGELEHFSYTITHDMRAPLRAMLGFADMMTEACARCQEQEPKLFLRRIATSATRMDALVTDALNYNRTVRQQELELTPVDVGRLLRGMLDTYPELQPSRAQIEIEGELPLVMGNEAGLTQCFSNLLGNAVKFVKPGQKPQIRVRSELVQSPAPTPRQGPAATPHGSPPSAPDSPPAVPYVRIWVEDNGIGIPEPMLPRVFDMFARGHQNYEGTGIGLALVRKVMHRMGGKLGVQSQEGKGSRFWLDLKPGEPRSGR